MRATIFNAIHDILNGLTCLKGSDGTIRIYKFGNAQPDGYPAVSITSGPLRSEILDTFRNKRYFSFNVRLVQEKMPEFFGPEKGERVAREREDEILAAFDADNDLGVAGVLWTNPKNVEWGYTDGNTRIVLDITLEVATTVQITH